MPGVHKINDPYIGLAGMLPVQTPSVLLQRPLPGHWHGQHQCVEWRVVEALANEFASRK